MSARSRRDCLRALLGAGAALAGCTPQAGPDQAALAAELAAALATLPGGWVGAAAGRGHRLRTLRSGAWPAPARQRRTQVLIVGAGVAGLAAARVLRQAGIEDFAVLELEDAAGGNARGHRIAGLACPLGAHYLPLPGPQAAPLLALLEEFGLARFELGRWAFDERHLCHAPQERLWIDGAWHDSLLPPAEPGSATQAQYRRFAARVAAVQREVGFAMPSLPQRWTAAQAVLEALTFGAWLQQAGLDDARLLWYLDYCCRDDYGAGLDTVSAWAGLHYFASRHGFHAPGDEEAPREPVLTWPEGNAWLTRRLAAPLGERLQTGRSVLRVRAGRHAVELQAWDERGAQVEQWQAEQLILALPLFIAARLLEQPPEALRQSAAAAHYAPWLVANLQLRAPLLARLGAPPAWDNVIFDATRRSASLGYVDAQHQSLSPARGPTVLTLYRALPASQRAALLQDDWRVPARAALAELLPLHPDLPQQLARADLMRYGHAMRVPLPGTRSAPAQQALLRLAGRIRLAHADLAGYSVFEEAFSAGELAARQLLRQARC